jgi:hypothetical protein
MEEKELIPTPLDEIRVLVAKYPAIRLLVITFDLDFEI